jgi:hypothetical protein
MFDPHKKGAQEKLGKIPISIILCVVIMVPMDLLFME